MELVHSPALLGSVRRSVLWRSQKRTVLVKMHLSHNSQQNTEEPPNFVLHTVCGASQQASQGRAGLRLNRKKGAEHEAFAHFAIVIGS